MILKVLSDETLWYGTLFNSISNHKMKWNEIENSDLNYIVINSIIH